MRTLRRTPILAAALVALGVSALATPAAAEPCDDAQLHRILAPARPDDLRATVDCDLELTPLLAASITRQLVFEGAAASGATLDCHGGVIDGRRASELAGRPIDTIVVTSRRIGSSWIPGVGIWEPANDVTIRDCEVIGSIRVRGMANNGNWGEPALSSHVRIGHVERMRAAAPRRTTIDGVTIVGTHLIPLYVAIGVSDTLVTRSYITGRGKAHAIYLDPESRRTTVRDSTIDTAVPRELVSIDGSEENRFIGNWFSHLQHGGIYLYRNCGEGGSVRITTPSHNEIINNVFYYARYDGSSPAVYLGSENGQVHRFCGHDAAYPWGSGADDRDFATENVVMQNQFYYRSPADMIRTDWPDPNSPNHVAWNTTVTSAVSRPAGCFVRDGYRSSFVPHGGRIDLLRGPRGHPYVSPLLQVCVDGDLRAVWNETGRLDRVAFSCAASGDDGGCSGTSICPGLATLVGAHAACDLEGGRVTDAQLASVPGDVVRVVRASDTPSDGRCWVRQHALQSGELSIAGSVRPGSLTFGCREHDANGGDCQIRGVAYCYSR